VNAAHAKRRRVLTAVFQNLDTWIDEAVQIADSPDPHSLALHHARNMMQARAALGRLLKDVDDDERELNAQRCVNCHLV
jgi:hypothetical protein